MGIFNIFSPNQKILRGLREVQTENASFQNKIEALESRLDFLSAELKKIRKVRLKLEEPTDEDEEPLTPQDIQRALLGLGNGKE